MACYIAEDVSRRSRDRNECGQSCQRPPKPLCVVLGESDLADTTPPTPEDEGCRFGIHSIQREDFEKPNSRNGLGNRNEESQSPGSRKARVIFLVTFVGPIQIRPQGEEYRLRHVCFSVDISNVKLEEEILQLAEQAWKPRYGTRSWNRIISSLRLRKKNPILKYVSSAAMKCQLAPSRSRGDAMCGELRRYLR